MKKNRKKILILVVISILGIGFAAIKAATLTSSSRFSMQGDNEDFNIELTDVSGVLTNVETSYEIGENSTLIPKKSYTQKEFNNYTVEGNKITFSNIQFDDYEDNLVINFKVKNNSTKYDANLSSTCSFTNNNSTSYNLVNYKYNITNTSLEAKKETTGTLTLTANDRDSEDKEVNFTCTVTATAKSRKTQAEG